MGRACSAVRWAVTAVIAVVVSLPGQAADEKAVFALGEAVVKVAHPTGQKHKLKNYSTDGDTLTINMDWQGGVVGLRYTSNMKVRFESAGGKTRIKAIDYADNAVIGYNRANIDRLIRLANENAPATEERPPTAAPPTQAASSTPAEPSPLPPHVVELPNGKLAPQAGYEFLNTQPGDFRVKWVPGLKSPTNPGIVAADKEGDWKLAPGFRWLNDAPGDMRTVRVGTPEVSAYPPTGSSANPALPAGPSKPEIQAAVAKTFLALTMHIAAQPQSDDGIAEAIARALARAARDECIDSALDDLLKRRPAAYKTAVKSLVILAFDRRLDPNRDRIMSRLREADPDAADAAQVAEFLILLLQAVAKS